MTSNSGKERLHYILSAPTRAYQRARGAASDPEQAGWHDLMPGSPSNGALHEGSPGEFGANGARHAASENPRHESHQAMTAPTRIWDNRMGMTHAIQKMLAAPERETQLQITGEHILAALLLAVIFFFRISNLSYNTLHLDEAIYATVGQDALAGNFEKGASQWMFGSYMYPVAAGLADELAGVFGLRALSAVLITTAAYFVYRAAARLFGGQAALWALLVFGMSGVAINLGQQAVLDALSVPFVAMALYAVVLAMCSDERPRLHFLLGGLAFAVAVLAKYIALLMLPAFVLLIVLLNLYQKHDFRHLLRRVPWPFFVVPAGIILGLYGAVNWVDLRLVFSGQFSSQLEPRPNILVTTVRDLGLPILFTIAGMVVLTRQTRARFDAAHGRLFRPFVLTLVLLAAAILAIPLYQFAASNIRSLSKHHVFSLVFLAPFAAHGITHFIQYFRTKREDGAMLYRTVGAAVTAISLFWFVSNAAKQNADFHSGWPNQASVLQFLNTLDIGPDTTVLSPAYAVYEYYADMGVDDQAVWNNVWYTEYNGLTGEEGVVQAIRDCRFDVIVIDNYYAPEWAGYLESMLDGAGYVGAYSTHEQVSTGSDIRTNVYLPAEDGACVGGSP